MGKKLQRNKKTTIEGKKNVEKNMKSKLPQTNQKKTRRRAARGGRSIRVETLPQSSIDDSPGVLRETWERTCEDLSHAMDAIRAPDTSIDARVPRDDPP